MTKKTLFAISSAALLLVLTSLVVTPLTAQEEGFLRTRIDPYKAGVFVNGEYYGTAAMFGSRQRMIKLAPGTYDVEIVDPRYKTLKAKAQIKTGETTTIRRAMEPLGVPREGPFGELITEGFGNAAVYLNGKYYANTAELGTPGQSMLLKPGEYSMKIVPVSGADVREETIEVNANETLIISRKGASVRRK